VIPAIAEVVVVVDPVRSRDQVGQPELRLVEVSRLSGTVKIAHVDFLPGNVGSVAVH